MDVRELAEEIADLIIRQIHEDCLVSSDRPGVRWDVDLCCVADMLSWALEEITDFDSLIGFLEYLYRFTSIDLEFEVTDEEAEQIYRYVVSTLRDELRDAERSAGECEEYDEE